MGGESAIELAIEFHKYLNNVSVLCDHLVDLNSTRILNQ